MNNKVNSGERKERRVPSLRLRSDVIFKAVIRDMRKFFIKEFNCLTNFKTCNIKKKADKTFIECLELYIDTYFRELMSPIEEQRDQNLLTINKDLLIFLGCLIYPKDILNEMKK